MIRKAIVTVALMLTLVASAQAEVIILPNGGTIVKSGSVTITPSGTYIQGDGYTVSEYRDHRSWWSGFCNLRIGGPDES